MATKKPKGLGRGLEALLGPKVEEPAAVAAEEKGQTPHQLALDDMVPGIYQPRTRMDEGALIFGLQYQFNLVRALLEGTRDFEGTVR